LALVVTVTAWPVASNVVPCWKMYHMLHRTCRHRLIWHLHSRAFRCNRTASGIHNSYDFCTHHSRIWTDNHIQCLIKVKERICINPSIPIIRNSCCCTRNADSILVIRNDVGTFRR
jgi:hypothetical protein